MTPTFEYQLLHDTAPAVQAALATQVADGWRPILLSTAPINTTVQVFILLERPIPTPYTK
jgi:hypothetical protein